MSTVLPAVQYTVEDLKSPQGIDMVLMQVQGQIQQLAQNQQPPPDPNTSARQIWPILEPLVTALIQQQMTR